MNKIDIGRRLEYLRKYVRISRKSLAEISNISVYTIRAWEEGRAEIRPHNLEKYLKELRKIGCSATVEWVMNGGSNKPHRNSEITPTMLKALSDSRLGTIEITTMIDVLSEVSNLLYYLDSQEHIIYINPDLLFLLGKTSLIDCTGLDNTPFKDICSEEIYNVCHKQLQLCQDGRKQKFSYTLGNPYSKNPHIVEMFCCPLMADKSNDMLGILGFVSSHRAEVL